MDADLRSYMEAKYYFQIVHMCVLSIITEKESYIIAIWDYAIIKMTQYVYVNKKE